MVQSLYLDKLLLTLCFLLLTTISLAQQMQFMHPTFNKTELNPALPAIDLDFRLSLQHQERFINTANNFLFRKIAVNSSIPLCFPKGSIVDFSLHTTSEGEGNLNQNRFNLNWAYQLRNPINNHLDQPLLFSIGISIGGIHQHLNWDKLVFSDQLQLDRGTYTVIKPSNAIPPNRFNTLGWNYNLGFVLEHRNFLERVNGISFTSKFGASLKQSNFPDGLNSSFYSNSINTYLPGQLSFFIDIDGSKNYKQGTNSNIFVLGAFAESSIGVFTEESNQYNFNFVRAGPKFGYNSIYLHLLGGFSFNRGDFYDNYKMFSTVFGASLNKQSNYQFFASYNFFYRNNLVSQYPTLEIGIVFRDNSSYRPTMCNLFGNGETKTGCPYKDKKMDPSNIYR